MTPTGTYEHLAIQFPAVWAHQHSWVKIHDGEATRQDVPTEILAKTLGRTVASIAAAVNTWSGSTTSTSIEPLAVPL